MAKKKTELTYLQLPLPQGSKAYKMTKRSWSGLNKRQTIDTGALSMEKNISTAEAPYLTPSPQWLSYSNIKTYDNPIGLFGFDDFLLVVYRLTTKAADGIYDDIKIDYLKGTDYTTYTGTVKWDKTSNDADTLVEDNYQRSIVKFNVYDTPTDPLTGEYVKKLLIFPDKKVMSFNLSDLLNDENNDTSDDFKVYDMESSYTVLEYTNEEEPYLPPEDADHNYYYKNTYSCEATLLGEALYKWCSYENEDGITERGWKISIPQSVPDIKYATVHLSRVFGVDDSRVYASAFNDYANWSLDVAGEYNESNAWCSPAQSNTAADGDFTGITTFQNHVVCFKRDFMHEIYNTKNPFRVQDIYAEGAIDNRTIQDVDGRLIFVSGDNVKVYTGSNPRIISYYLNIDEYKYAVSGTDGRNYYLYCEDGTWTKRLFVYDTIAEQWSEQAIELEVLNFAHNKNGMYALCADGNIYRIDTKNYTHNWSFETDLITNETVDIKHIKKIQMFAEIAKGAKLDVYMLYDDEEYSESSHLVYSSNGATGQRVIRVKPRQTASYGIKLHVEGYGYVKLYELELVMQAGGELYV